MAREGGIPVMTAARVREGYLDDRQVCADRVVLLEGLLREAAPFLGDITYGSVDPQEEGLRTRILLALGETA